MDMIENARSGIHAAQVALNVASQNVANEKTPGYSRRDIVLATPWSEASSYVSPGVNVVSVRRINDDYKNRFMWDAHAQQGQFSSAHPYFEQLERVIGGYDSSVSFGLDNFFMALDDVSQDVASRPLREQVIQKAHELAQCVNDASQVLTSQLTALDEVRRQSVEHVNAISKHIANLNTKIVRAQCLHENDVASLQDERDRHIDQLASLLKINVIAQQNGSKTVTLNNGLPLVTGDMASLLAIQSHNVESVITLQLGKEVLSLTGYDLGGQLGGINHYEHRIARPMRDSIMTLAYELATRVNQQLAMGFDLNGAPGKALFVLDPSGSSETPLQVTDRAAEALGFSRRATEPGNDANLLAIAAIKTQTVMIPGMGETKIDDVYGQLIGRLAAQSQQNNSALQAARHVRDEAEKSWKVTSGVDRDDEAAHFIDYLQMCQANMRVVAVARQLFDSMLAIV